MPKKKFIDKKKAVTFHLVHRSQQDPLVADEDAPKHVLVPEVSKKRLEQQRKFGVYFDDDYNYLQHLKDVDNVPEWEPLVNRTRLHADAKFPLPRSETTTSLPASISSQIQLPSSVFQSNVEESVGLLNKAAPNTGPHPDWDPDIVAALDDDFRFDDSDNELDDDFMNKANADPTDMDYEEQEGEQESDSGKEYDEKLDEFETGTRFTNYSMSSSILPRSEIMQTLDERFEKMFEEYDDLEVGDLDGEEFGGCIDPSSQIMEHLVQDFEKNKQENTLKYLVDAQERVVRFEEHSNEALVDVEPEQKVKEDRWDCESILSTYSDIYNRPKLIIEKSVRITVNPKTGIPEDVLTTGLTEKQLKKLDGSDNVCSGTRSVSSRISSMTCTRPKGETADQKKERKKIIKEFRKERRTEKKANKEAFKEESKRQQLVLRNLKQNLQGIKLA